MTKIIKVENKESTEFEIFIDNEYFDEVAKHNWYVRKHRNTYYAETRINNKRKTIHRLILEYHGENLSNLVIDHIDGNGLNNQKSNLRICTNQENSMNRRIDNIKTINSTSKYKGVSWDKDRNKWISKIQKSKKSYTIGLFNCEKLAAKAYDQVALYLHGEFSCLNFPDEQIENIIDNIDKVLNFKNYTTSKYIGVYYSKSHNGRKKWRAYLCVDGKKYTTKYFATEEEAYTARETLINSIKGSKNT